MEKKHVKIFPVGGDSVILPRKIISMVISKGISFSWKRWCCATGAKLESCLARIAMWLYPPQKILACISLSRLVLLHRTKILYNLIVLQRFTLVLYSRKSLLRCRRKWTGTFLLGTILNRIQTLSWTQTPALILTHGIPRSAFGRKFI